MVQLIPMIHAVTKLAGPALHKWLQVRAKHVANGQLADVIRHRRALNGDTNKLFNIQLRRIVVTICQRSIRVGNKLAFVINYSWFIFCHFIA
jgi:hypothetical protein